MGQTPLVSVIIPAFKAADTLPAALASIAGAGLPAGAVEAVVASDDGTSYEDTASHGLQLTFCDVGPVGTGAGPARNRAIHAATADVIAFLDADDTWGAGFLTALLPLARSQGAAFGQTIVFNSSRPVMQLPGTAQQRLSIADVGRTGASYHPVLQRQLAGPFVNEPSQDVLHTLEVLSLVGGDAPLGDAAYHLHLRGDSATAQDDFSRRLGSAYARYITLIEAGKTRIKPVHVAAAAGAFRQKAQQNDDYAASGTSLSFYEYMAVKSND